MLLCDEEQWHLLVCFADILVGMIVLMQMVVQLSAYKFAVTLACYPGTPVALMVHILFSNRQATMF